MAKGQVDFVVIKTDDDQLLLQVKEPDVINRQINVRMTVHPTMESLLGELKRKLSQALP